MGYARERCVYCRLKVRLKPKHCFIVSYDDEPWYTTLHYNCDNCSTRSMIFISGDIEYIKEYQLDGYTIIRHDGRAPADIHRLFRQIEGKPPLTFQNLKPADSVVVATAAEVLSDDEAIASFLQRSVEEEPPDTTG